MTMQKWLHDFTLSSAEHKLRMLLGLVQFVAPVLAALATLFALLSPGLPAASSHSQADAATSRAPITVTFDGADRYKLGQAPDNWPLPPQPTQCGGGVLNNSSTYSDPLRHITGTASHGVLIGLRVEGVVSLDGRLNSDAAPHDIIAAFPGATATHETGRWNGWEIIIPSPADPEYRIVVIQEDNGTFAAGTGNNAFGHPRADGCWYSRP